MWNWFWTFGGASSTNTSFCVTATVKRRHPLGKKKKGGEQLIVIIDNKRSQTKHAGIISHYMYFSFFIGSRIGLKLYNERYYSHNMLLQLNEASQLDSVKLWHFETNMWNWSDIIEIVSLRLKSFCTNNLCKENNKKICFRLTIIINK